MRALTICQPYAHLIITPQAELPHDQIQKRVENRTWETKYRGPLLIHAGLSKKWLLARDQQQFPTLVFGALIGMVELVDCVRLVPQTINGINRYVPTGPAGSRYPWLMAHCHTEGPCCWIVDRPHRFEQPIPYAGKQGLFHVPDSLIPASLVRGA